MTIVGKILVFINLVFSLLLGFLVIVVYAEGVKSGEVDKAQRARLQVVEAENQALREDRDGRQKKDVDFQDAVREAYGKNFVAAGETPEQTRAKVADKLAADKYATASREALVTKLQKDLVDERAENVKRDLTVKYLEKEARRRQDDVEQMRVALADEVKKTTELLAETTKARQERTKAELDAKTAIESMQRLERQVQELTTELVRTQQNNTGRPAGGTTLVDFSARNPPPADIEGLILVADERSDLYRLSIGSDSGLQKGQTLEAFRLSRTPGQSKYLGTVRITDVGPKEAVAVPVGRLTDRLRPGDWVASRINKN